MQEQEFRPLTWAETKQVITKENEGKTFTFTATNFHIYKGKVERELWWLRKRCHEKRKRN